MYLFRAILFSGALMACAGSNASPPLSAPAEATSPGATAAAPSGARPGAPPAAPAKAIGQIPADANPALRNPGLANEKAPEVFKAKFETSEGDFVIEVHRDWAPLGADRFFNLVKIGFFDEGKFFRAINGFMVQFGISGDPEVSKVWREANIQDDPAKQSNTRGRVTFAMGGPNTRTSQVFINYVDANRRLDGMGFAPLGEVVDGMNVVDKLYKGYGEGAPGGMGPDQGRIQVQGNTYLERSFPKLSSVKRATIVP